MQLLIAKSKAVGTKIQVGKRCPAMADSPQIQTTTTNAALWLNETFINNITIKTTKNMKRILSLLTLLVIVVTMGGYVHAQTVFTAKFNGGLESTPEGFFTVSDPKLNYNTKYKGRYDNEEYTKGGLKLQNATYIGFTTKAKSTITIVQSISSNSANLVALDGTALSGRTDDAANNIGVYTVTAGPGTHQIKRAKSECGILYIKVEYTGSQMTQLTEPAINFNNETGEVTISQTEKKDVYYTIDGTAPSATNGTKYENPFAVEDGTTIKAVAIGDGTATINSNVATYYALLKTVSIQKPEIATFNGTVAISCFTPGTACKYSVNGGELQDYSYPFTLTEDARVKAVASRENCTDVESDEVSVTAVKNTVATKTIMLDWNKFDLTSNVTGTSNAILKGKADTDAEGYSIELLNNAKNWSNLNKMTVDGAEYQSIKLSNGAENILNLPEGVKASRITFYSVINTKDNNTVCGWKNVNGLQEYECIPMGAYTKYPAADTEYDVRVYPLDNATQVSFTNAGLQLGFVIALDIVDEAAPTTATITISDAKMATYSNISAWKKPAGMEVYTAKYDEAAKTIVLNEVTDDVIPANTGVVVRGAQGTYTADLTTTAATSIEGNDLVSTAAAAYTATDNTTYVLTKEKNTAGEPTGKICFGRLAVDNTVAQGMAYLKISNADAAKTVSIDFGDTNAIRGIENVENVKDGGYYTLSGQHIAKPGKGLYIHGGKKFVVR